MNSVGNKKMSLRDITLLVINNYHNAFPKLMTLEEVEKGVPVLKKVRDWTILIEFEDAEYKWLMEKVRLFLPRVYGIQTHVVFEYLENLLDESEVEEIKSKNSNNQVLEDDAPDLTEKEPIEITDDRSNLLTRG